MGVLLCGLGGSTVGKWDEICYPFTGEDGMFCDYEIMTDGLSSYLGLLLSIAKERNYPVKLSGDLEWLTEMAVHMNGSIRGKLAVTSEDLDKLYKIYNYYKDRINIKGFTLPTGSYMACQCNIARHKAKEVVRLLNKINKEQSPVPDIIFSFSNLLANLMFVLSCYVNDLDKVENKPFISKSY
jgi:cob(I)alamin adenosyltransferase